MARLLRALRRTDEGFGGDDGMSTAEYCIGIVAACAFAAVLYKIVTGGIVHSLILKVIGQAFKALAL